MMTKKMGLTAWCCVYSLLIVGWISYGVSADLSAIVDICCEEGTSWADEDRYCDNYPSAVEGIQLEDQIMCRSILEVCCLKSKQDQMCENGKADALAQNGLCAVRDDELGAVTYKECCSCCNMGLAVRAMGMQCIPPAIGNPCDFMFTECCIGNTSSDGGRNSGGSGGSDASGESDNSGGTANNIDDMDECMVFAGELCSQICINTIGSYRCDCNPGYKLAQDGSTCYRAVSQCAQGHSCSHECLDTNQGIICTCRNGFMLERDGISCVDIDECARGLDDCRSDEECLNNDGSFTCRRESVQVPTCRVGYVYDPQRGGCIPQRSSAECRPGFAFNTVSERCEDIDECIVRTAECGVNELCINTFGSYYCRCEEGFYKHRGSTVCEDIDECGRQMDTCTASQRCENTMGSFVCRRITPCGTGWTLDEKTQQCVDQNECEIDTHNCGPGYECFNIEGSFRCNPRSCPIGSRFSSASGKCERVECGRGLTFDASSLCVDINECESSNICRQYQKCVNSYGSYQCVDTIACASGEEVGLDGNCVDIDECASGTHDCSGGAVCINRVGGFSCSCQEGYVRQGGICVDKDECQYGTYCPFNSRCENTMGSFTCICNPGMEMRNQQCVDIDECQNTNMCQHRCVNVMGSFHCSCNIGYQLEADKRSCKDVDECQQYGGRGGLCGGECINTPGSYMCTCPEGWRVLGNGRSCQDIDECLNRDTCGGNADAMCFNTRGSHKCPVIVCPPGFSRSELGPRRNSVRCKRLSFTCRQGDQECINAPLSLSYNFLSFPTNVKVPTDLFSMSGPQTTEKMFDWHLNVTSVYPAYAGVQTVNRDDFDLRIGRNDAIVSLRNRIMGAQDIELMLIMTITDRYTRYSGKAVSRIYLYVTPESIV